MTLLSGGEQALTAMALIFAVFLTNPSPICVLDEVDAPLDDANVERFCALLDDMRRRTETRFVVITHNPITMANMDRLYGVTMAERGVSQVVSVDLQAAERFREARLNDPAVVSGAKDHLFPATWHKTSSPLTLSGAKNYGGARFRRGVALPTTACALSEAQSFREFECRNRTADQARWARSPMPTLPAGWTDCRATFHAERQERAATAPREAE